MRVYFGRNATALWIGIIGTRQAQAFPSDMLKPDMTSILIDGSLGLLCGMLPLFIIGRRSWPVALLGCWLCVGAALSLGPFSALLIAVLGAGIGLWIPAPSGNASSIPASHRTIFLYADGKKQGPYTRAEVLTLWESGALDETTLYWEPGLDDWRTLAVGIVAMRN